MNVFASSRLTDDAQRYVNHLYQSDLEGYVQLIQFEDGRVCKIFNTEYDGVVDVVEQVEGQNDTYITPNTFYIPIRRADNMRHFRALYIDIDLLPGASKIETTYQVYLLADQGLIPRPTMVVDSGRGIHLYWRIKNAPIQAWYTWQELEDYVYKQLKHLGADRQATDGARVLRLPSTINSRNNMMCKVLHVEDTTYTMYDLRKTYLRYNPKQCDTKGTKSTGQVKYLFNSYSLHMARASDIETLCRLRHYDVKGHRNGLLHCYAYWKGIYIRDMEALSNIVYELNNNFLEPQKQTEVDAIIRSVDRAIDKFIDYEQGIRTGDDKRISKNMRNRGGYWYKNETLIDMLGITEEEQKHLKTIIDTNEKYRRNNERRRKERRNSNGLTQREQKRVDTVNAIAELREQGLTLQETANRLNMTIDGIKYYLYR